MSSAGWAICIELSHEICKRLLHIHAGLICCVNKAQQLGAGRA